MQNELVAPHKVDRSTEHLLRHARHPSFAVRFLGWSDDGRSRRRVGKQLPRTQDEGPAHMKPALCTHKYTYPLDERGADILVRYTHQIIEGTDVVTLTGIEADSSALAGIKDDMFSTDNDHLLKDLADDLVFSATFRWTDRIELRVDPAFAQVATQVFEWECR